MVANSEQIKELSDNLPEECGLAEDGSISSGIEILTPPLYLDEQGEKFIATVCRVAQEAGAEIDRTCGLHLHIGAKDYIQSYNNNDIRKLRRLLKLYALVEDLFFAMLPPSRYTCSFCKPLSKIYAIEDIERLDTQEDFDFLWYKTREIEKIAEAKKGKYNSSRYAGLNIHALLFRGNTIEVRYHSGTINAEKILHWVKLNLALFKAIDDDNYTTTKLLKGLQISLSINQKLKVLAENLPLNLGTLEYIAKRVNKFNAGELQGDNDQN